MPLEKYDLKRNALSTRNLPETCFRSAKQNKLVNAGHCLLYSYQRLSGLAIGKPFLISIESVSKSLLQLQLMTTLLRFSSVTLVVVRRSPQITRILNTYKGHCNVDRKAYNDYVGRKAHKEE